MNEQHDETININIMEFADIEYQIIANAKVIFNKDLDFSLLYIRDDSKKKGGIWKDSDWEYKIERSTLGTRDNMMLALVADLKSAQKVSEISEESILKKINFCFGKEIIINESDMKMFLYPENSCFKGWSLYSLKTTYTSKGKQILTSADQAYEFIMIAVVFFNEAKTLLILGLNKGNKDEIEKRLSSFHNKIENAYQQSHNRQEFTEESVNYITDESYKTFSHIMQAYRKMLAKEEIQDVHFFRLDGTDLRLYYQYEENFKIDQNCIDSYKDICIKSNSNLVLSENQKNYVKERLKKTIKSGNSNDRNEPDMFQYTCELFDKLGDPEFIEDYFNISDNHELEIRQWLLQQVLSCIPQEPWTGVAGHSAETRTIDISRDKDEKRWDPSKIDKRYFYSKLVIYESLVGVGGKGSMVAFPILDCGQISGVLFATRRMKENQSSESKEYTSPTLIKLLELSTALKYFVWFKRKFDFIDNVLKNLVNDPDNIINPILTVGKFMPELFNPALVVIWELTSADLEIRKPKYIFGYQKDKESSNDGLMPLLYNRFDEVDKLYDLFSSSNFEFVKCCENKKILTEEEVMQILSKRFLAEYGKRSFDGLDSEMEIKDFSIGNNIKSGIVITYNWEKSKGWILIFTTESDRTLSNHRHFITQKLNVINRMISFEMLIKDLLDIKLTPTHDIRGGLIRPIEGNINKCIEFLNTELKESKKNLTINRENLQKAIKLLYSTSRYQVNMLDNLIAGIDGKTYCEYEAGPKYIKLFEILKIIWDAFKTTLECSPDNYNIILSKFAECILIDIKTGEYLGNLDDENSIPEKIKELTIYFSESKMNTIIYNILVNIYRLSTIPFFLIKNPDRAKILISFGQLNKNFITLTIEDKGIGMTREVLYWVNSLFNEIKRNSRGDKRMIKPKALLGYKNLKGKNEHGLGRGLFRVASALYSSINSSDRELITVESTFMSGTKFTLQFPTTVKEEENE